MAGDPCGHLSRYTDREPLFTCTSKAWFTSLQDAGQVSAGRTQQVMSGAGAVGHMRKQGTQLPTTVNQSVFLRSRLIQTEQLWDTELCLQTGAGYLYVYSR